MLRLFTLWGLCGVQLGVLFLLRRLLLFPPLKLHLEEPLLLHLLHQLLFSALKLHHQNLMKACLLYFKKSARSLWLQVCALVSSTSALIFFFVLAVNYLNVIFCTIGLRKVTTNMKTKNRADRTGVVTAPEKASRTSSFSFSKAGPPKLELQMGRKWAWLLVLPKEDSPHTRKQFLGCLGCVWFQKGLSRLLKQISLFLKKKIRCFVADSKKDFFWEKGWGKKNVGSPSNSRRRSHFTMISYCLSYFFFSMISHAI